MQHTLDLSGRPIHFIGIGGIGMSALAYILTKRRLAVSGSDLRSSNITRHLQELGARIFLQQDATNFERLAQTHASLSDLTPELRVDSEKPSTNGKLPVLASEHPSQPLQAVGPSLPQVVCSTAIQPNNPEYQAALARGYPIFHRSDVLAALIQEAPQSIAVAGTHGKTTTSSLIGYLLFRVGLDPTIVIGGEVAAWQGNARIGHSPYLVAEADESDGSLAKLTPTIGVITNIELDHPDYYSTLDQVVAIFETFVNQSQTLVVSLDCPVIRDRIIPVAAAKELLSYSLRQNSGADYTVGDVVYGAEGTTAQVFERGQYLGELHLPLLGEHNLSNALAAVAIGRKAGLEFSLLALALSTFEGARRRFEYRGEAQGICFVDDYAHHPSEIRVTLASARLQTHPPDHQPQRWQRVVALFQPHRYSRTHTFLADFSRAFRDADVVVVTDIYSAGEADTGLINGAQVADAIASHHAEVYYQPTLTRVTAFLEQNLQPGDFVICLGAGDLNRIIPEILAHYQLPQAQQPMAEAVLQ